MYVASYSVYVYVAVAISTYVHSIAVVLLCTLAIHLIKQVISLHCE